MRVLGVDPGLTRCGLGLVQGGHPRQLALVAVDVVRTRPDEELGARLLAVDRAVGDWLDEHRPDAVALERVFSQHNVRTVMGTAQVSGVVLAAAARRGIPVGLHTPSEVKAAVTGSGRAGKEQVTNMVTRILALASKPRPADAADALALAICHLWRGPAAARIEAAKAQASKLQAGRTATRARPANAASGATSGATAKTWTNATTSATTGAARWQTPRRATDPPRSST
ncbi:crossover junction endodeoxyribonuclease RuvC [Actinopolymorpha singaporensis]|uniref:Crossover junction endodeoxyribonuclease RuvC n=1 Tax=Actinopolymorpha singaporensis TaxID=117157 RepID=A0A1H1VGQ3_9ACTN|nr:crossover junction endodeoxyribonuclease RuvC [Actinopolymorpha singaporensis]SDS83865.1 Holliday junction endonuclease RuvC [Actinopolymorpha singaporensis]